MSDMSNVGETIKSLSADNRDPEPTELQLADLFSRMYSKHLRYVAMWGKWLMWDGKQWKVDETLHVFDLARKVVSGAGLKATHEKAATVAAVERLARADRRHAVTSDIWDANPWALNTPGGIVDLRTGTVMPHDPAAYCTKITACEPDDILHGECPQFEAFIFRALNGDVELIKYMQRVAGYTLTGVTFEQQLWFLYGTGGNGKGVFLNALTGILGDYAKVASMETFTSSHTDKHPTDLAMLRGARFVTAQETEEGRNWAEARVKAITGGDPITARFMQKDFFTFLPQFKLIIAGNHKPGLRNIDEAILRRFNLIPFTVTIPREQRDPELPEKLRSEWPGILRWAIDGCIDWQKNKLKRPNTVSAATTAYMEGEDTFSLWLSECTERKDNGFETAAALFASWSEWAGKNGEKPGTAKKFSQAMASRGFLAGRSSAAGRARGFSGVELTRPAYDEARYG